MNLKIGDRFVAIDFARRRARFAIPVLCASALLASGCTSTSGSPGCEPQAGTFAREALPPARAGYYRANSGDTVSSVASGFSRDPSLIAQWNGMSVDSTLVTGQLLRVAPVARAIAAPPAPACEAQHGGSNAGKHELAWPADGPVLKAYGTEGSRNMVIAVAPGAAVRAARGGRVVYVGSQVKAYGKLIVIKHDSHLLTAYGNTGRILIREGAVVTQGQVIADVGDQSDENRSLIFEVRRNRIPVDPTAFLPACQQAM